MGEEIIPMAIGVIIGLGMGFLVGRDYPRKNLVSMAYGQGRVDAQDGKPWDIQYKV
jgi:hypothetical protein